MVRVKCRALRAKRQRGRDDVGVGLTIDTPLT
jgi:hypothetical protein